MAWCFYWLRDGQHAAHAGGTIIIPMTGENKAAYYDVKFE
jgi:hypothetical protein